MVMFMPCIEPTCKCQHEVTCQICGSNKVNHVQKVGPIWYIRCEECRYDDAIFFGQDMKGLSEKEFLQKYPCTINGFHLGDTK